MTIKRGVVSVGPRKRVKFDYAGLNFQSIAALDKNCRFYMIEWLDYKSKVRLAATSLEWANTMRNSLAWRSFSNVDSNPMAFRNYRKFPRLYPPIRILSCWTKIERLNIVHCNVDDLTPISRLTLLRYLNIQDTLVLDLSPITNLKNLKYLNFGWTGIINISVLKYITSLRRLHFAGTPVTNAESVGVFNPFNIFRRCL